MNAKHFLKNNPEVGNLFYSKKDKRLNADLVHYTRQDVSLFVFFCAALNEFGRVHEKCQALERASSNSVYKPRRLTLGSVLKKVSRQLYFSVIESPQPSWTNRPPIFSETKNNEQHLNLVLTNLLVSGKHILDSSNHLQKLLVKPVYEAVVELASTMPGLYGVTGVDPNKDFMGWCGRHNVPSLDFKAVYTATENYQSEKLDNLYVLLGCHDYAV